MNFKKIFLLLNFLACCIFHAQSLHLYGGADQDQYLGCLNCDPFDKNSVWNKFSDYGNVYSSKSIWNAYGNYGSAHSTYSPWSAHASYPPGIVDENGIFYGYLTLNPYKSEKSEKSEIKLALILCKHYEEIKNDIDGWYQRLFR